MVSRTRVVIRSPNSSGACSRPSSSLSRREPLDPFADAVEWLAPEQLDVGLGGRHLLGGLGGAAEVERGMRAVAADDGSGRHGGVGDLEVLAVVGDVLLGPQPADDLDELLGTGVTVGLVALAVAVGAEVVLAGHDVDQHPAAGEMVQGRGGGGEVRRPPVAGPDRDQRLERRRPRGQGGGDGEGVRASPAGAEQRPVPAVLLERGGVLGEGVQAVVVVGDASPRWPGRTWLGMYQRNSGAPGRRPSSRVVTHRRYGRCHRSPPDVGGHPDGLPDR